MNSKRSRNIFSNTLVAQIIFIAIVAGAILLFERFSSNDSPTAIDIPGNEAALFIDFDNMQRMFTGEVVDGMTVLDALNASSAAGQIKLVYHVDSDNSTRVKEINDHMADEDTQFVFYVNSRKLDPSKLNKKFIKPGDKITIRLE